MSDAPPSPCRLHVYLAREAPLGVVLRRGPSAWSRLSLWHTDTDVVEHGQWLHGRVYPRRCDVSADGSLFVYFTHKATGAPDVSVDSWAAVSRPPYFTALALWGIGMTYFAGGFFHSDGSLFLSSLTGAPDLGDVPPWLRLTTEVPYVDRTPDWTDRTVYFNRLLRDGWTPVPTIDDQNATWEHPQPGGDLTLIMAPVLDATFQTYGGRHQTEYALRSGDHLQPLGRATWADWGHRGRLILAQDGRLREHQPSGELREIADFNGQTPDPQPSPPWAHGWPPAPRGA